MTAGELKGVLRGVPDSARVVIREGVIGATRYVPAAAVSIDPRDANGRRAHDVEVVPGVKGSVVIVFKEQP